LPYPSRVVATRKRPVMLLTSDSSFMFHIADWRPRASKAAAGVRCGVDHQWVRSRRLQRTFAQPSRSPVCTWSKDVRFDKVAEASAVTANTGKGRGIGPAIERAYASGKSAVVHVCIDRRRTREMPNYGEFRTCTPKAPSKKGSCHARIPEVLTSRAAVDPLRPNSFDVENRRPSRFWAISSLGPTSTWRQAARRAFTAGQQTSREQRLDLLEASSPNTRSVRATSPTQSPRNGAPPSLAAGPQVQLGSSPGDAIDVLKNFPFEEQHGATLIAKEPIACAADHAVELAAQQIRSSDPALATGCTMVLKPSEVAPFSAYIFTESLMPRRAGRCLQPVNAMAPRRRRLASHPDVDMVSFTGSTRAVRVATNALRQ